MPRLLMLSRFRRMESNHCKVAAESQCVEGLPPREASARARGFPLHLARQQASPAMQALDQMRETLRLRHYAFRTERAYVDWARRFILFHGQRHPAELDARAVAAFLTHLALERKAAPSTQYQARAALIFLYGQVLRLEAPWLSELVRDQARQRLPMALSISEVQALLGELHGQLWLIAALLYGSGLRLREALRLRVQDLDFSRCELLVREDPAGRDRLTVMPEALVPALQAQLNQVQALHEQDLAAGYGQVPLPQALAASHPTASRSLGWQWVFPGSRLLVESRSGEVRRHPVLEGAVQRAIAHAARRAGIPTPCSSQALRHAFALHRLQAGHDVRSLQALLGHRDVRTTLVYTHVLATTGHEAGDSKASP